MFKHILTAVVGLNLITALHAQNDYERSVKLLKKEFEFAQQDLRLTEGLSIAALMPAMLAFIVGTMVINDINVMSWSDMQKYFELTLLALIPSVMLWKIADVNKRDLIRQAIRNGLDNEEVLKPYLQ